MELQLLSTITITDINIFGYLYDLKIYPDYSTSNSWVYKSTTKVLRGIGSYIDSRPQSNVVDNFITTVFGSEV